MSEYSRKIRHDFAEGDRKRDKGLKTPDDIIRYDNISYGPHPEWNLLDIYRPKAAEGQKLPVIAIVHGGAWVYGDKNVYQFYGMSLAQRGFAVVNYSYRLAPEYQFPTPIEDTCAVLKWVYDNADKYNLDITNVFAVGDSAGAHILGSYAAFCTDPAYKTALKKAYPAKKLSAPRGIKLNAIALNCGKYDLNKDYDKDENLQHLKGDYLPKGGTKKEMELNNVTAHITDKFPPSFIMTCPGDFLRSQAAHISSALNENSVPFCYRYYGSAKKPLHHVFHCNMRLEEAVKCNDDECDFFRQYMK